MEVAGLLEQAQELVALYGLKLVAAIAIFIIGKWVAKIIKRVITKMMAKGKTDPTVIGFAGNIAYVAMMAFVVLAALGQLGIQTTSFIAILGAAGLAIGLALQGSLSNFAAGFLMIIFRPFKVGDFIEGAGVAGVVEEISIFTTTMKTGDNKTIIIPNSSLSGGNIINYSTKETRRVDLTVGVSYDADLKHVKGVLEDLIAAEERILKDPAHMIAVTELAADSVNLVMRMWVKSGDYWPVMFAMTEAVKVRLDKEGIGIPYQQRDVHVYEHKVA
ncbi:MAG: mechanosensitive ion channel [Gammaproteobacteria bacterium]|nr:mechanosensitive ion channel [Gammaproteobacteria bacterium]